MISDFVIDLLGAVFLAALFLWRQRKRFVKAWKWLKTQWKWLRWCIGAFTAMSLLYGQDVHIAIARVLVMLFVLSYCFIWRKRYKKARGKLRQIYFLPEGDNYADRERLAGAAGKRPKNPYQNYALGSGKNPVSPPVAPEAGHERLLGQWTPVLGGRIWRRENQKRRAHHRGLF